MSFKDVILLTETETNIVPGKKRFSGNDLGLYGHPYVRHRPYSSTEKPSITDRTSPSFPKVPGPNSAVTGFKLAPAHDA